MFVVTTKEANYTVGFGKRMRHLRQANGLTQKAFGEMIGVDQTYVSSLETEKDQPTERLLKQIASQFHVREEWLRDGQEPMIPSMEELMAPVLDAIGKQGQPAKLMLQMILAKARLYDAEFSPVSATPEDRDLFMMIAYLRSVWASANSELQSWLKIQFRKSFPDFDEVVQKSVDTSES